MRILRSALLVFALAQAAAGQTPSARGDANADGSVNTADADYLADNIVGSGPAPLRSCLADVNADSSVGIADVFRLADFVSGGVAPPSQPAETCNGADDDCDGAADEDFDLLTDPSNCGTCGTVCESNHSVNACMSGVCTPICAFGWVDSDGNPNNGCDTLLNTNPACTTPTYIGSVAGDSGSETLSRAGVGEAWLRMTIREDNVLTDYLSATVTLTAPGGVDYDLYAYCFSCGGSLAASSTVGPNGTDQVYLRANDDDFVADTHDVILAIIFRSAPSSGTGAWSLTVTGNTAVGLQTCNP